MSTRALITFRCAPEIVKFEGQDFTLYHHTDGDPSDMMPFITGGVGKVIAHCRNRPYRAGKIGYDASRYATKFAQFSLFGDSSNLYFYNASINFAPKYLDAAFWYVLTYREESDDIAIQIYRIEKSGPVLLKEGDLEELYGLTNEDLSITEFQIQ